MSTTVFCGSLDWRISASRHRCRLLFGEAQGQEVKMWNHRWDPLWNHLETPWNTVKITSKIESPNKKTVWSVWLFLKGNSKQVLGVSPLKLHVSHVSLLATPRLLRSSCPGHVAIHVVGIWRRPTRQSQEDTQHCRTCVQMWDTELPNHTPVPVQIRSCNLPTVGVYSVWNIVLGWYEQSLIYLRKLQYHQLSDLMRKYQGWPSKCFNVVMMNFMARYWYANMASSQTL